MKPVKSSVKKVKSARKKSKSSGRSESHPEGQILQDKNDANLQIISKKGQDDANWESGQEEKNERELKAVKDLCALSEEESGSISVESNFQKLWMDSGRAANKDLSWMGKENDLGNPSLTAINSQGKRLDKRKSEPRVVSRVEVANILHARNFLKENMFFRMRRDWSKDKKLLGKAQMDKLLSDRNAEISNSLRELKEKTQQERYGKGESDAVNRKKTIGKYALQKFCNNYSQEERISLWHDSSKDPTQNEENNTFVPKGIGIDARTMDLINSARPYSSNKMTEKSKSQNTKILRHEIIELIEKFEKSNRIIPKDPSNIRIKKVSNRYTEDTNPEATNATEVRRESDPRSMTVREAYNPPIRSSIKNKEVLVSEETPVKDLRSQVQQVLSEGLGSQSDDNGIKFKAKTFYKVSEEKGNADKPPLSSRGTKRDGSTGKMRFVTSSKNPNSRRIEKYSFVTRDCSSLPQSIIVDEQFDSSRDLQQNKVQNGEVIISSCQNILTKDRPVTASLESPQRKNIIKILNYFRNCGEARNSSGNSVLKKLIQNSHQKRDRTETRSMSRVAESDFSVKLPDSFRAPVGENHNLGNNSRRTSAKRSSMVSMKAGNLSAPKNFREIAISTLQKAPSATFLQAVGKKLN